MVNDHLAQAIVRLVEKSEIRDCQGRQRVAKEGRRFWQTVWASMKKQGVPASSRGLAGLFKTAAANRGLAKADRINLWVMEP